MLDPFPRHVRDVQQAVDPTEIDKCAVIGEVLDDPLDDLAFLETFQQLFAFGAELLLDDGATRDNDVVTAAVEFDDFEFEVLAFEISRVPNRPNIDQ